MAVAFGGGAWKLPGPWLEPSFTQKGHGDRVKNTAAMPDLIRRYNDMLVTIPTTPGFEHVMVSWISPGRSPINRARTGTIGRTNSTPRTWGFAKWQTDWPPRLRRPHHYDQRAWGRPAMQLARIPSHPDFCDHYQCVVKPEEQRRRLDANNHSESKEQRNDHPYA